MLKAPPKQPKHFGSTRGQLLKTLGVAEVLLGLYAYSIYYRLNRYQDFRHIYHKKHPWILNMYYTIGEKLGGYETRKHDLEHWNRLENVETKS